MQSTQSDRDGSEQPAMQAGGRTEGSPARPAPTGAKLVLIIEDEPALLRALRINLEARGYRVSTAASGRAGLAQATQRPPDAVLLDLGLPDMDGTEVIAALRGWSRAPVIVLSGRAGSGDKIGALDAGADDYVTKPFSMAELMARLRAALRRDEPPQHEAVRIGQSVIDLAAHTAVRVADHDGGRPTTIRLTPTEWRLLELLLRAPGQLISSARLLATLWGPGHDDSTHYLRFHMAGLRRKLEDDPHRPRHLLTEPGMGYRYQP
jgi:two-component system, OmpR family, KDP operon response regulator KdpE